jgi:hypothetical protein
VCVGYVAEYQTSFVVSTPSSMKEQVSDIIRRVSEWGKLWEE